MSFNITRLVETSFKIAISWQIILAHNKFVKQNKVEKTKLKKAAKNFWEGRQTVSKKLSLKIFRRQTTAVKKFEFENC
jgi:hypothetical protein